MPSEVRAVQVPGRCDRQDYQLPLRWSLSGHGLRPSKTVCTLTALKALKYDRLSIGKVLVIAPKKVAEGTWAAEAEKWDHLRDLRISVVLGSAKERTEALQASADIYVTNRENTQWIVEQFYPRWPFDVVVLDESSSFKNHRAKRFRALRTVRPKIERLIELTGTPAPKNLMDLWAQVYLLDGGKRLGRTMTSFRDLYFIPGRRNRTVIFDYQLKKGADKTIYQALGDICVSMKTEDYLELPELLTDDVTVVLDRKAQKAYNELEKTMLLDLGDGEEITAASAAALTGKLLQLCNGACYVSEGEAREIHTAKLEALTEALEALNGQHALVYYHFQHDRDRICEMLKGSGYRVRVYRGAQDMNDWNSGEIDVLLAQPASCGYGLNLQAGGRHVIWFGLTWNLEEYQQANKRLHRMGQTEPVVIHRLIVKGGADEDVIRSLELKDKGQEVLLAALKARIEKARRERST